MKLLDDSGATANVIDQKLRESIKVIRVKCVSQRSSKELFAYGGNPLKVIGSFQADVSLWNGKSKHSLFCNSRGGTWYSGERHSCESWTVET